MSLKNMTVNDIMTTALVTLRPRDTVSQADLEMKVADIRHIPVVDEHGILVGILSNRDLLRSLSRTGSGKVAVHEVMSTDPVTVTPETTAAEAAELMLTHRIGALPVVGDEEQLVGIVTETDFLELAYRALSGQRRVRAA